MLYLRKQTISQDEIILGWLGSYPASSVYNNICTEILQAVAFIWFICLNNRVPFLSPFNLFVGIGGYENI